MDKLSELASLVASRINAPRWHYLTTPLTSTAWDGDARSTEAITAIDLSAVFGVPANAKAVLMRLAARDSGSASGGVAVHLGSTPYFAVSAVAVRPGSPADNITENTGPVPCNADGDIYYSVTASGSGTMDVWLYVIGYYL